MSQTAVVRMMYDPESYSLSQRYVMLTIAAFFGPLFLCVGPDQA